MKSSEALPDSQADWFVCSDLVSVRRRTPGIAEEVLSAVLEEIGPEGAVVQLESSVAPSTSLRLVCQGAQFDGVVRRCRKEPDLGYFAEISFAYGERWSVDVYRPRHVLDLNRSGPHAAGHDHKDFAREGRWEDSIAPADDPPQAVHETIRQVAQNMAVVCGEMDLVEMAQYFSRFFRSEPQGILFGGFVSAYRSTRESTADLYELPVSPLRQASRIAALLGGLPEEAMRQPVPVRP